MAPRPCYRRSFRLASVAVACGVLSSPAAAQPDAADAADAARIADILQSQYPRILRYVVPRGGLSVIRQIRVVEQDEAFVASIPHLVFRDPDPSLARQLPVLSLDPFQAVAETEGDDLVLTYQGPLDAHLLWRMPDPERLDGRSVSIDIDVAHSDGIQRFGLQGREAISLSVAMHDVEVLTTRPFDVNIGANLNRIDIRAEHREVAPGVIDGSITYEFADIVFAAQWLLHAIREQDPTPEDLISQVPVVIDRVVLESQANRQHDDWLDVFRPLLDSRGNTSFNLNEFTPDMAFAMFGDPPLIRDAQATLQIEGLRLRNGVALSTIESAFAISDAGTDAVGIEIEASYDGLQLASDADALSVLLAPRSFSLDYGIRDLPGRSMASLAERLDETGSIDWAELTDSFDWAETTIFLEDFQIVAPGYTVTGFGQFVADGRSPTGFSGQAAFAMSGLDTVVQALAGHPDQAEVVSMLTMMQALGDRTAAAEDGSPLWSYSFVFQPDGSVTLNGSDITALIGSMVPA